MDSDPRPPLSLAGRGNTGKLWSFRSAIFLGTTIAFSCGRAAFSAGDADDQNAVSRQDITIHGNGPAGPVLSPPPAMSGKPIADEVIHSLRLYKTNYKASGTMIHIPGTIQRLSRPFPESPYLIFYPKAFKRPYDRWAFEVLADGVTIWRSQGNGSLEEGSSMEASSDRVIIGGKHKKTTAKLTWDGTDSYGAFVARVGQQYSFRFAGFKGNAEYAVSSEPVELTSLTIPEGLNGMRLEVALSTLYSSGEAGFSEGANPYLQEIADRFRRINLETEPYRFSLYAKDPQSKLAMARAQNIVRYFSKALLVNPSRIAVSIQAPDKRGEVMTCVIPITPADNPIQGN